MNTHPIRLAILPAVAIALLGSSSQASPPTPWEIREKIHDKVRSTIFKVTRIVEGTVHNQDLEEDPEYYDRHHRHYDDDERYLEPLPPPPPPAYRDRNQGPPPDYYYHQEPTGINRGSGGIEYYTPDYVDPNLEPAVPDVSPPIVLKSKNAERNSPSQVQPTPTMPQVKEIDPDIPPVTSVQKPGLDPTSRTAPKPEIKSTADLKYATPVPNKAGFVYPPGVKQEAANMLDVRGLSPGQKARDPRTGETFLVP